VDQIKIKSSYLLNSGSHEAGLVTSKLHRLYNIQNIRHAVKK